MAIERTFGVGPQQGAARAGAGRCRLPGRGPGLVADARGAGRLGGRRPSWRARAHPRAPDEPRGGLRRRAHGRRRARGRGRRQSAVPASRATLLTRFLKPSDSRLWRLLALLRRGVPAADLQRVTGMAPWFLSEMERLADLEHRMREEGPASSDGLLVSAKRACFSDHDIGALTGLGGRRQSPRGAMRWACVRASPWSTPVPPSSRPRRPTSTPPTRPAARHPRRRRWTGRRRWSSAPARYASARASSSTTARCRPPQTLRDDGDAAVMINSNPETVSTDFDASSRLYFEPLDEESVMEVIDAETPDGAERAAGAHPVRRPDAAQPGGRARGAPACRCRASTWRPSTGPRSAPASRT